jgi:hypothetical protein
MRRSAEAGRTDNVEQKANIKASLIIMGWFGCAIDPRDRPSQFTLISNPHMIFKPYLAQCPVEKELARARSGG